MSTTLVEELSLARHLLAFTLDPSRLDRLERLADVACNLEDPRPSREVVEHALRDAGYRDLAGRGYRPPLPDIDRLAALAPGTLGHAFAAHMRAARLQIGFYRPTRSVHPGVGYLAERQVRTHDIFHVLTGYDTTPHGELALQAFSIAQLPSPINVAILVAGLVHLLRKAPSTLGVAMDGIASAHSCGHSARFLLGLPWEEQWECGLDALRRDVRLPANGHDAFGTRPAA